MTVTGPLQGLQQVVLDDVAYDAEAIEVAATALRAQVLLESDLDGLDVFRAPERFEDRVGPTQRRDVEQHLM